MYGFPVSDTNVRITQYYVIFYGNKKRSFRASWSKLSDTIVSPLFKYVIKKLSDFSPGGDSMIEMKYEIKFSVIIFDYDEILYNCVFRSVDNEYMNVK